MKRLGALALVALLALPAMADDDTADKKEKSKGKNADRQERLVAQMLKQLVSVGLTDEQSSKIKELAKASEAKLNEVRKAAGITPELTKKLAEVQKSMKGSEKKGNELQAAVNEAAGLTESQVAAFKTIKESRSGFQKMVVALLTDEQKGKLPERLQRAAKPAKDKKSAKDKESKEGKKKKEDKQEEKEAE